MTCKVRGCTKQAFKKELCNKHYMKLVRKIEKLIFETRTRPKGQKALHVRESVGIYGDYTEPSYEWNW